MVKIVVDGNEKVLVDPALIIKGENGRDGKDGRDGVDGRDGEQGIAGKDGRDGIDGKDGKDGVSYWIEYDKKKETLIFKNDGGKKNPEPIKLSTAKGWGYGAGGRGGVTAQSDWKQKDKNAVDYIKNKPADIQVTIIPEASKDLEGLVIQYIGETITGYMHGYFYECMEKDISTITFTPDKISCSGDSFMAFLKTITPDYNDVVSGTMTYLEAGDIWVFVGNDKDGQEVVTYQQYTGDFENFGFTFTGTFEDEEVISFARAVEVTYGWERIDVQPGTGRGRFLSLWDCATGLAVTDPPINPYVYNTGDYFIVSNVSNTTNKKPSGLAYNIGVASTVEETGDVSVDDTYVFDGTNWKLQQNVSKVRDVQIKGTSIVTNGVANIIPAELNGNYGVVKLGAGTGGLAINSSGNLYVVGASQGQTAAKLANINNPVMPGQIDTAVKAGLTTNTLTFTDAEKLAARTLIGAGTGNSNLVLDIGTGLKETDGVQYDITGTPTITNGVLSGITDSNYLVTKGTLNSTLSNDGDSVQLDFSATVKTATVSTGNLYTIYVNGQNYLRIVQSSTGNRLQVQGRINNTNVVSVNSGTGVFPQNEKTYIRIKETRVSSSSYTFDVSYSADGTTYTSISSTSLTASCLGAFNGEKIAIGVLNTPSTSGRAPFSNGDIDLKDFKVTKSDVPLPWILNAKGGTLVQANLASSISSASTHEELVSAKLLYEELEKIKALI